MKHDDALMVAALAALAAGAFYFTRSKTQVTAPGNARLAIAQGVNSGASYSPLDTFSDDGSAVYANGVYTLDGMSPSTDISWMPTNQQARTRYYNDTGFMATGIFQ